MTATATATRRIALIGNPNTGKTTIFNALTGHRARVGNYAGVTVEKREGDLAGSGGAVRIVDLPGTYSLAAQSPDEMVAVRLLLGTMEGEERPDGVVVVVDASNVERNLFLATQVMELGLPVVIALNMTDVARAEGVELDAGAMGRSLGVPVVSLVARDRQGIDALVERLHSLPEPPASLDARLFPDAFLAAERGLRGKLEASGVARGLLAPFLVRRALLDAGGMAEATLGEAAHGPISEARADVENAGLRLRSLEASCRYKWIRAEARGFARQVAREGTSPAETSDRMDRILTHRVWGTLIFTALMTLVFQAIFSWSAPAMDAIDGAFGWLGGVAEGAMAEGPLRSLVVDGVIAGVGGVVIFLPQILVLFLFIALLEDIGYMSRAAFLMDRVLSRCGLSGRSFIPMLSSFACAIPGVMAARTIEDPRDRLTTILVAPLMSCSARIPVYVLLIQTFVPDRTVLGFMNLKGLVMLAMYSLGVFVAIPVALLLKKGLLRGRTPVFLIELPPYRRPLWTNVLHRMWERGREFVIRAGTLILATSVLIWALSYYPRSEELRSSHEVRVAEASTEEAVAAADAWLAGEQLRQSYLGRMGHFIEPLVEPLGWDWRIGMAVIASFPAREVIVATLGVIFDLGGDQDEESEGLRSAIKSATWPDGRPLFTLPVALGVMVFFALCMQCVSTLAIMRRETNSWRWPAFAFAYMTTLAYVGAFVVYRASLALLG